MFREQMLNPAGTVVVLWQAARKALLDRYRPERHYMRGPGPKWREKYQANAPAYAARSRNPGSRA
jgi:hypothetical protein